MRVTKTIREFIEREVSVRLAPKYESEKQEAKRQSDAMSEFYEGCAKAAEDAFNAYFEKHFPEIADFAEDEREKCHISFYASRVATIRNRHYVNNIHNWDSRKRSEAKKICDEIIVELELGGTKAELMEMLDKIGKE